MENEYIKRLEGSPIFCVCRRWFTMPHLFLFWVLMTIGVQLFAINAFAQDEARMQEIQKKIEELFQEMQTCGEDADRIDSLSSQIEALSQEFQEIMQSIPTPPNLPDNQEAERAAREILKGQEDDPCYDIKLQKETSKIQSGSDLPFLRCWPIEIFTRWDIDWNITYEDYDSQLGKCTYLLRANFILEENYAGCFTLMHDPQNLERILYAILSGIPADNSVFAKLLNASYSESWTCSKYHEGDLYYTAKFPSDFGIDPLPAHLGWTNCSPEGVPKQKSVLDAASVTIETEDLVSAPPFNYPSKMPLSVFTTRSKFPSNELSTERVMKGWNDGELILEIPFEYIIEDRTWIDPEPGMEKIGFKGILSLKILFNKKPGKLEVSPEDNLYSSGPDKEGTFAPPSMTYMLKNTGDKDINVDISKTAEWLDLSTTNLTLSPEESKEIVVTINEKAKHLEAKIHEDKINFTNTTNGEGSTSRAVTLNVNELWRITIDDYMFYWVFYLGPGPKDKKAGMKVHIRRVVEVMIENEAFKSGTGKAEIISLDNYSYPDYAYICKLAIGEIVGRGTALDGTRADQVIWTKRFNPPQNEKDAKLREQWLKITKHKTPYIWPENFSVEGAKAGDKLDIWWTQESGCTIGIHFSPNLEEWNRRHPNTPYTMRQEDEKEEGVIPYIRLLGRFHSVMLIDGWSEESSSPDAVINVDDEFLYDKAAPDVKEKRIITVNKIER